MWYVVDADDGAVPQQVKVFAPDYEGKYAPNDTSLFFTNETLNNWNELMPCKSLSRVAWRNEWTRKTDRRSPVGMGFQWVNDTHRYHDLPTPIVWPEKTVFTTSITHQLHCLVVHPHRHPLPRGDETKKCD